MTWKEIKAAFDYLYDKGMVHTQREFAERLRIAPETVSKMFGSDNKVSPGTVIKLGKAFEGVFSKEWLLTGEGDMLQASHLPQEPIKDVQPTSAPTEMEKWLMRQNEELVALLKQAHATIKEKDQQIINLSQNMRQDVPIIAANYLAESSPKPYEEQKKF